MKLFIAVRLPQDALDHLSHISGILSSVERVNAAWVPRENFHLTLVFLGEVDISRVPDISRAMKDIARTTKPFMLSLSHVGAFPELASPRVIWHGLEKSKILSDLAARLTQRLRIAGCTFEEREYRPHITLARAKEVKRNHAFVSAVEALPRADITFPCTEIVLFSSNTNDEHSEYEQLASVAL
jgi:2'-5' RNA ligase